MVNTVVLVPVRVNIDIVQVVVDLVLEQASHHVLAVLGRELLRQPQQQLVLVAVAALVQLAERILQILHRVVPQFEEELDDIIGVLLLRGNFSGIHSQ